MAYSYLIQGKNIVIVIGSNTHTISSSHISYDKIKEAIKAEDWDAVQDLVEPKKVIVKYGQGNVEVQGDKMFWKGKEFHNYLAGKFVEMYQEGFPVEPMVNFMENLMQNPSKRAVEELYGFLEKGNLPITADGHFLAYKKIRNDYKDIHSGTMDNSVGTVVEMERNEVDDNRNQTCSTGLHFCSHSYLAHFSGARTVIVKINPRDVVSIPSDYDDAKGRTCRYEVVGEVGQTPDDETEFNKPVQSNANSVPVKKVEPKTGSTSFYRGYTDGYEGKDYNNTYRGRDYTNYDEGYDKGANDSETGFSPRYQFVNMTGSAPAGVWPFPNR